MSDTTRTVLIALGVTLLVVILLPLLFMGGMMGGMMRSGQCCGGVPWLVAGVTFLVVGLRRR